MIATVGVHEAKTNFSRLLHRVEAGEEILITRGREPVARLVPVAPRRTRELGFARGELRVSDDFDAPLPEDLLAEFER
jgi:prevent-host-death family protein